jgi:hypothetical protein
MPERIQRKRTKGWKMPAGAVYVGRPTKFGNPFSVCALQTHNTATAEYDGRGGVGTEALKFPQPRLG